jgi:1-pyrroline-5-carboxylate dehydrogenase
MTEFTYTTVGSDEGSRSRFEEALDRLQRTLGEEHPMYIGETEVRAGRTVEVRSPIDHDILLGGVQAGGDEHIRDAIAAGQRAFPQWSGLAWKERTRIIRGVADRIDRDLFLFAARITMEAGKTMHESLAECGEIVAMLRFYADVYEKNEGYDLPMPLPRPGENSRSVLRPYGLWAVISPFNFPLALGGSMAAGALLTGNTVILKPTTVAPLSGIAFCKACIEGGVPPGVINLVTAPGSVFGEAVATHPMVDGIAFTGSRAVGMALYRRCAAHNPYPKPVVAEMGSKNPVIVTGHADTGAAVQGIIRSAFTYSGQKCSATSRAYVHADIREELVGMLVEQTQDLVTGDPRHHDTFTGPLIGRAAADTFRNAVSRCTTDGGTVLAGGALLTGERYHNGFYAIPTIATGLPRDHPLMRDELFVPFLVIDEIHSLAEGIAAANDTDYGLTAGIFSRDEEEVRTFFEQIRFGVCYANRRGGATTGAWPGAQPFTGWKGSGLSGRGAGGFYYLLSFVREQGRTRQVAP